MEKRFTTVLGVVAAFIIGALAMWLWFKPTIDMVQDSQKVWQQRLLHCEANQVDALTERREVVSCPKKLAALKREISDVASQFDSPAFTCPSAVSTAPCRSAGSN